MNPQDDNPFKPTSATPPPSSPLTPPADISDPTRNASADVIRDQIGQILGGDEQPNHTISHSSQPMIAQSPAMPQTTQTPDNPAASQSPAPASPLPDVAPTPSDQSNQPTENVYDRTHAPTSDTENLHTDDRIASRAAEIAAKQAEDAAISEAHQKYHTAWQGYYQKYYERYYIAALQEQRTQFASQQATVDTSGNPDGSPAAADGTLTQKEAMEELRDDLLGKIQQAGKKARKSRHFIPAIAALVVIMIAVFIQYNGLIFAQVASFVSPGDITDQNIIIGTGSNQPIGPDPRLIIPKINVDAPVIYDLPDLGEASSQRALEDGPIHYPIAGASAFPGQNGNTVILGHSSADWFEPGNFKFIFVQLNRLSAGDLFYIDYNSVRYTYRVTRSEVIAPNQISALAIGDERPFATLITCDPPGTALRRLVVFADQISPDPNAVIESQSDEKVTVEGNVAGNPPTLFERIFGGK